MTKVTDNAPTISLGTVAQGFRYGAVNEMGEPTKETAFSVFDEAWARGIRCFDTARAYGEAEERIGAWRQARSADIQLISKLPPVEQNAGEPVGQNFGDSIAALRVNKLFGYLCHRSDDLQNSEIMRAFGRLASQGLIERYGASLYTPRELRRLFSIPGIGIAQLPVNVACLTQDRIEAIGEAADRNMLVFVRSVYLQGILVNAPERIPHALSDLREPVRRLHAIAAEAETSAGAIALASVRTLPGVHSIVIGAETPAQLAETIRLVQAPAPGPDVIREAIAAFACLPPDFTDPSHWPRL